MYILSWLSHLHITAKEITAEDSKRIFAYRTRMANFGENFRGQSDPKQCPLCLSHLDNQQMAYICPKIKPSLNDAGKYDGIFKMDVPIETIRNLRIIDKIREENL